MTARRRKLTIDEHVQGVLDRDRMILARTITLIESNHPEHRQKAQHVLRALLPHTGRSHRIGITGVPGVGKSTFIESLGQFLLEREHRVAVLAVDPTSSIKGGSILGDKTRMQRLAQDTRAFIRPSPSQGNLGGVHRKTRETMLLCEAAGFDVLLVETVGVGQSETTVADMVDSFLVLMLAGAGDELQGIKKGILEVADIITINKADGDNALAAKRARLEYHRALQLVRYSQRDEWKTHVLTCSGLYNEGIQEVWDTLCAHQAAMQDSGGWDTRRQAQRTIWMWSLIEQELMLRFREHPHTQSKLAAFETAVQKGTMPPTLAAEELLNAFAASSTFGKA